LSAWRDALVGDERHGPLPVLLLALTVVTGLVDAVSILSLGRVFVANMTGNVVFIGFALAGAAGFSLAASACALGGFLAGALSGGWIGTRFKAHRGRTLLAGVAVETGFVAVALVMVALSPRPIPAGVQDGAAGVLGLALGIQNAVVRDLAVPDLTTTVLTMTLTGLAADVRRRLTPAAIRRLLAVTTMFAGAIIGATLVLKVSPAAGLGAATGVLAAVAMAAAVLSAGDRSWHRRPS
jgi:uncharacterized membrane protein YoaK (UPF0700 family)